MGRKSSQEKVKIADDFWYNKIMYKDPRGPNRTIAKVEPTTNCTKVSLDCGHVAEANQVYTYRVGDNYRCIRCLLEVEKGRK